MNTFQTVVVPVAGLLAVHELVAWIRGGNRLAALKCLVWCCFASAVYQPNLVQWLANAANIGRGTDLLLYTLCVFVLLSTFHFMKQFELQRQQLTTLVRELAISRPQWPDGGDVQRESGSFD